jgi:hypothetical protein
LGALVSAAEQNDQDIAALREIDPIARAMIDAHLADRFADRLDVARIAKGEAAKARQNPRYRHIVAQAAEPFVEFGCPKDLDQGREL